MLHRFSIPASDSLKAEAASLRARLTSRIEWLISETEQGSTSFLRLPLDRSHMMPHQPLVERVKRDASDVVILGTGGSSLGAQALYSLSNGRKESEGQFPKLHFPENLGAYSMDRLLDQLDMGLTHFIVISKSGTTAETLAQFAVCLDIAGQELVKSELHKHFTVIVEPGENPLRQLAQTHGFSVLDHSPDLGGRFSVFSLIALLPAMLGGVDVAAFRNGGARVIKALASNEGNAPASFIEGAVNTCHLMEKHGVSAHVMMPYDSRLDAFSRWYQQLCAESLGKDGKGLTPIRALGPVDQHSQLQLFLDGPKDKLFTLIREKEIPQGHVISEELAMACSFEYMAGRRIGDVVNAMARATRDTLRKNGLPVREIIVPEISEESLGELMMHFILETILIADLLGVDPFDQPAVEQGKALTRDYLANSKRT